MHQRIIRLIADIDEFKGHWNGFRGLPRDTLNSMKRFATIESIGSSTRIEGAALSDSEVEDLLHGLDTRSFRSRDEQEVAGYAQAIRLVYDAWQDMELTESMIKGLHRQLLQHSAKDEWHLGDYKHHPNHVAAFDSDGRQIGIVFETTSPFETPMAMANLIQLTQHQLHDPDHHPLLAIGEFIVRFLAIHPFQDGNGRLARILTNLLLLRAGYSYVPYSSLEQLIEANKEEYYRALRESQQNLDTGNSPSDTESVQPDLDAWLLFFFEMLKKQTELLKQAIELETELTVLPDLSQAIVDIARQRGQVTVADVQRVTNANRNTIKLHLRNLIEQHQLVLHGKGRGAYYTLS
jgi:Fic family protein